MDRQELSDETLVAFADGELDAASASAVKAAAASDPALAKRLEIFVVTRGKLRDSLGPVAKEPVPDRLTQFVMTGGVTAGTGSGHARPDAARRVAPAGLPGRWRGRGRRCPDGSHRLAVSARWEHP